MPTASPLGPCQMVTGLLGLGCGTRHVSQLHDCLQYILLLDSTGRLRLREATPAVLLGNIIFYAL